MRLLKARNISCQLCYLNTTGQLSILQRWVEVSPRCRPLAFSRLNVLGGNLTQVRTYAQLPIPEPARIIEPEPAPKFGRPKGNGKEKKKDGKRSLKKREYNTQLPFHVRKVPFEHPAPATLPEHYDRSTFSEQGSPKIKKVHSTFGKHLTPLTKEPLPPIGSINRYSNSRWNVNRELFNEEFYDDMITTWFTAIQHHWTIYTDLTTWDFHKTHDRFAPFRKYEAHVASLMFETEGHSAKHTFIDMPKIFTYAGRSTKAALAWMIFLSKVPSVLLHDTQEAALVSTHYNHIAANLAHHIQMKDESIRPDLSPEVRSLPWARVWFYHAFALVEDFRWCAHSAYLNAEMLKEAEKDKAGLLYKQSASLAMLKGMSYGWVDTMRDFRRNPWENTALGRPSTVDEVVLMATKARVAEQQRETIEKASDDSSREIWNIPNSGISPFDSQLVVKVPSPLVWTQPPRIRIGSTSLKPVAERTFVGSPVITKHWAANQSEPSGVSKHSSDTLARLEQIRSEYAQKKQAQQAETTSPPPPLTKNPMGEGIFDDLWETVVPNTKAVDDQKPVTTSPPVHSQPIKISRHIARDTPWLQGMEEGAGNEATPVSDAPLTRAYYHLGAESMPDKGAPVNKSTPDDADTLALLAELRKDLEKQKETKEEAPLS